MSEYIIGLGISVKICKLYEKLIYLELIDKTNSDEYIDTVNELDMLVQNETDIYDKLDIFDLNKYYSEIKNDTNDLDIVKNRYYLKLKERIDSLDNVYFCDYPFTLDTAIYGKILLDSLVKIEEQFKCIDTDNSVDNSVFDLHSFHKTYKYTLISSNDFLERLAINFNFNLLDVPMVSFDKIKDNFGCGNDFNNKLNFKLYLLAIDIINVLINNANNLDISYLYSNLLYISQLEVIISYMDKSLLERLILYCDSKKILENRNGKFINNILIKKK